MRLARLGMLAVLSAVSLVARAELPMDRAALGHLEAVLEHCGRASPASAERYKAFVRNLTGRATDKELAEARASEAYRGAYDAMSDRLGQLPKEESEKACAEGP